MADDPFAQYAVKADDPFAAYADGAGATDGAAAVRKQIVSGFKARPIFEPGAGAAMLGAQSDPSEVLPSALNAVNPINWIKGLASAARLATNPQEIPGAANDALSQVLAHPGAAAGSAFAGAAMPPLMARVPAGRLLTAGTAGAKAGALRLPLVGPPLRAATRAAYRSWQETAPVAAETAAEVAAPAAAEAMPAAVTPASGMSTAERAALTKQYPPNVIAALEKQLQADKPAPMPSHAPTSAPGPEFQPVDAPVAQPAATRGSGPVPDQPLGLQPGFSPRDVADAATQMQRENPNIVAEAEQMRQRAALKGPRIRTGAERVGREAGMTKEAVREVTGPVLDEAVGEASPILPQKALERIIDDLKQLPRGGPEREAYVARATSGKTKAQVENARRTLEHLGFLVPAAVSVREGLERLMSSHGSEN